DQNEAGAQDQPGEGGGDTELTLDMSLDGVGEVTGESTGEGEEGAADWSAMLDANNAQSHAEKVGAERVLNQEEIDSLLGFSLAELTVADHSGLRAIIDSAMVSYERLPMLEIVF